MFDEKTVFILGAGASCHYGYPTGAELVNEVIEIAQHLEKLFTESMHIFIQDYPDYIRAKYTVTDITLSINMLNNVQTIWHSIITECHKLKTRLQQVNPLVIDTFLGHNKELQPIGKLIIALALLKQNHKLKSDKGNWCRFIIHKLITRCPQAADLHKNDVHFITFNYDTSLEYQLKIGLKNIGTFSQEDDVDKFLADDHRIIHVYGSINDRNYINSNHFNILSNDFSNLDILKINTLKQKDEAYYKFKAILDIAYNASQGLQLIAPDEKPVNQREINIAKNAIENAKYVYILGYGFDENNSELLNLTKLINSQYVNCQKSVMFTNFNDHNRINKKASQILFSDVSKLLKGEKGLHVHRHLYCEKSTSNVYDALQYDFDLV